ncbi:glycan-binding surface protein [Sphingobacterium bovistauri]|uniref:Surface glycan-binding protein B xyloglucan binding domain-containing protein n=1 Tax=Sphingobacterium bovistauri TaxID=2781959 RepID=A0ABS7Z8Y6_9SPHI|nr:glycan-binding surface protein [Sphingobacterium bovistauri]MCA5005159.1 hypothetical protein [Sphingobacterium bovistauri]
MRTKYKILNGLICTLVLFSLITLESCKKDDQRFQLTEGSPDIRYVRMPDANVSDSLLTSAFLGNSIAIVGENLTSVSEVWFNDQKGILNTSLITDNVIIISVPKEIPSLVTDKIYFINKSKADTLGYDFNILVPKPAVVEMLCEYVNAGDVATIRGNYFLPVSGSETPTVIFTPNIKATQVVSHSPTEIKVVVPAGATEGPIAVESRYGSTRSTFHFRDTRGMITNYDADFPIVNSWGRTGRLEEDPAYILSGKYLKLSGSFTSPGEWTAGSESEALSHYWGNENGHTGNIFTIDPATAVMKFEANVPAKWSAIGLSFIFAGAGATNGPLYEDAKPRGIWMPWRNTGDYQTDGWVTVSIPISEFKYNGAGTALAEIPAGFDNLNIFLANRGLPYVGTDCNPVILIDNLRVVPQ